MYTIIEHVRSSHFEGNKAMGNTIIIVKYIKLKKLSLKLICT